MCRHRPTTTTHLRPVTCGAPALAFQRCSSRGASTASSVDHVAHDTTSILKLIEQRFALEPLSSRDAAANSLATALIEMKDHLAKE